MNAARQRDRLLVAVLFERNSEDVEALEPADLVDLEAAVDLVAPSIAANEHPGVPRLRHRQLSLRVFVDTDGEVFAQAAAPEKESPPFLLARLRRIDLDPRLPRVPACIPVALEDLDRSVQHDPVALEDQRV